MNPYKKLLSNTGVLWIGTFGSKLLVFLLMPLYTACLSTEEYGIAELISTTANLLIPLACIGVTNAVFRFCVDTKQDRRAVFSSAVAVLFFGLTAFLVLSPLLSLLPSFSGFLWLIVAYVIFADIQAVCAQYIRAIEQTTLFAVQGIFNTGVTVLFNLLFLLVFDLGVTGYVLSVILGNILTTVLLIVRGKLWNVFSVHSIRKQLISEMLRFCAPLIPTTICWLITDFSDRYMVTYFCGSDVNGVYSAAYKIPTVINLLAGIFLTAWQFSAVAESADEKKLCRFYTNVFSGFSALIFCGATFLILFSGVLTKILLNSAYCDAAKYMPTLICAATLEAIVSFLATVYLVRKNSMHSLLSALAGTVCNLVLNYIWIPKYGAIGAAVATLCSYGLVLLIRMADVKRILPFRMHLPRVVFGIVGVLAISAVMTAETLPYRMLWAVLLAVITAGIQFPPLWKSCCSLFRNHSAE